MDDEAPYRDSGIDPRYWSVDAFGERLGHEEQAREAEARRPKHARRSTADMALSHEILSALAQRGAQVVFGKNRPPHIEAHGVPPMERLPQKRPTLAEPHRRHNLPGLADTPENSDFTSIQRRIVEYTKGSRGPAYV